MHLENIHKSSCKKILSKILVVLLVLLTFVSVSALAIATFVSQNNQIVAYAATVGWKSDSNGWWYVYNTNGDYYTSRFAKIDNVWYYFGSDGYMVTGWKEIDGKWYYFAPSQGSTYGANQNESAKQGEMLTGDQKISGKWYYFDSSGAMVTGWRSGGTRSDGTAIRFYYAPATASNYGYNHNQSAQKGEMLTGWQEIDGYWYYLSPTSTTDNGRSYSEGSARIYTNTNIGGKWYYFDSSGKMLTGWKDFGTRDDNTKIWRYFTETTASTYGANQNESAVMGEMLTGWQKLGGKWYYLSPSQTTVNGISYGKGVARVWTQTINGATYYFNGSGQMQTGWVTSGSNKRYFQSNGKMATGYTKIGNYYYYFDSNNEGYMKTGYFDANGKHYYFDADGKGHNGRASDGNFYVDGIRRTEGWIKFGDYWYYYQNGQYLTYTHTIDGKIYYFDGQGRMQTGWKQYTNQNNKWRYFIPTTKDGFIQGQAVTGDYVIDGVAYTFDSNGWLTTTGPQASTGNVKIVDYQTGYVYSRISHGKTQNINFHMHYVKGTSPAKYAYCLQWSADEEDENMSSGDLYSSNAWNSLNDYQKKMIARTTVVGFPNYNYGVSNEAAATATQMVINEFQNGWRTSVTTSNYNTTGGLTSSDQNAWTLYNMARNYNDLWKAYTGILWNLAKYENKPFTKFSCGSVSGTLSVSIVDGNVTVYVGDKKLTAGTDYVVNSVSGNSISIRIYDKTNMLYHYVKSSVSTTEATVSVYKAYEDLQANYNAGNYNYITINTSNLNLGTFKITFARYGTTASTQGYGSAVVLTNSNTAVQPLVYGTILLNSPYYAVETVNIKNTETKGSIAINKYDADDETTKLAGAVFTVYNSSGTSVGTITTNSNGYGKLSNLSVGKYTVRETTAPSGYDLGDFLKTVTISAGNSSNDFVFKVPNGQTRVSGNIILFKYDTGKSKSLTGAVFNIYSATDFDSTDLDNNTVIDTITIGENGYGKNTEPLDLGSYYAVEVVAPEGYELDQTPHPFTITENARNFTARPTVTLPDAKEYLDSTFDYEYGTVTVNAKRYNTSSNVSGAIINAFYIDGDGNRILVGTGITNSNGRVVFNNVALGYQYEFVNTDNIDKRYMVAADEEFVFLENGTTSGTINFELGFISNVTNNSVVAIDVTNEPFSATLNKIDADTLAGLPNATIEVYKIVSQTFTDEDSGEEVTTSVPVLIHTGLTDNNGHYVINGILPGEYMFKETNPPEGYYLNPTEYYFTIADDGTLTGDDTVANHKTDITLYKKVPSNDGLTLVGKENAKFEIYDASGTLVRSGFTNAQGELNIVGLPVGSYSFIETITPTGYAKNGSVNNDEIYTFDIKLDGSLFGDDTVVNQPLEIIIEKVSSSDGSKLPNVQFEIFDSSNVSKGIFTTNAQGQIVLKGWNVGTYTFVERATAEGYLLSNQTYNFTIDAYGNVTSTSGTIINNTHIVQVENEPNKVIISKTDAETGELLGGAEFNVYRPNGTLYGTFVTGNDETDTEHFGKIILTNLPSGTYTFVETDAPEGYALDETQHSFTVPANGTNDVTVTVTNELLGELPDTGSFSEIAFGVLAIMSILIGIILSRRKKLSNNNI